MNFPSIRLEGSILSADLLDAVAREDKPSQRPVDFGLDPSAKVKDEIASTWASAKALWTGYQAKVANLREGQTGVSETRNLFIIPLLALLGYQPEKAEAEILNGKSYAISHRDISRDGFPLHIMGWHDSLEKKRTTGGPRVSSHALVQEYLNLTEHLYALITNGRQLRLLRDSSRLIKLSFLDFDLERIFTEDLYADFALLFRLLHATRMPANRANASGSVIEKYHQESMDSGSRIRDGLAAAVAYSMQTVANGLLAHPENANLVSQLREEPARAGELHQNLLRWVYRTLFVLVIEERVLHHTPKATLRQRQLYRDFYSLQRLRRLADRPQLADRRAHDLWRAMHQTLRLYEDGGKGLPLGVAPLGSFLFREEGLKALFQYQLDNRSFLQALNRLSTFTHPDTNVRMRVNYGALDVEEFGSVYESLLELRPRIIPEGEKLTFSYAQLAGNERKTSGSYYTPDSLVQCLLDSALDPVIEERLAGKTGAEAEKALLSIKVCDKAVGSGHFLIGAAHRLARRLAEIRAGEEALSPDVQRHALRDVVSRCLYGVDINPLSVELCKVSLWMLGMEPGKPLSFLDHHIRVGNSLLGATPELIRGGIPEAAYDAIEGDDKAACAALKKQNKRENPKLGEWFIADEAAIRDKLFQAAAAIDDISDSRPEDIQRKETAFRTAQSNYDFQKAWDLANLWCAAFVIKKEFPAAASEISNSKSDVGASLEAQPLATQGGLFGGNEELPKSKKSSSLITPHESLGTPIGVTTQHLRDFAENGKLPDGLLAESKRLANQYQFFHWHLAFPEVFAQGGFDVNLGNPPWEKVQPEERNFFVVSRPDIALATGSERKTLMRALVDEDPRAWSAWCDYKSSIDHLSGFIRASGRYPLSCSGNLNTSSLFLDVSAQTISPFGRVGVIIPSGIATYDITSDFFQYFVRTNRLLKLFDFENREGLFPAVDSRFRFCVFVIGGKATLTEYSDFSFFNGSVSDLADPLRHFSLTSADFKLLSPNTGTSPVFHNTRDAELVKFLYLKAGVFIQESGEEVNPWKTQIYAEMYNMTRASHLFHSLEALDDPKRSGLQLDSAGVSYLPVYEARILGHFDHRACSIGVNPNNVFRSAVSESTGDEDHANPAFVAAPRYWMAAKDFSNDFLTGFTRRWFMGFRMVTAATNERTMISAVFPRVPFVNSISGLFNNLDAEFNSALLGNLCSFVLDYAARQRISGVNLNFFVVKQLPIFPPCAYDQERLRWIALRVLELTYTAWDLEAFAQDCGWSGPPFRWDEERRFLLRCELDAAFFHLYLGTAEEWQKQPEALTKAFPTPRAAVAYIMDTFPIVQRKDEAKHAGDYRTKRVILEIYDALAESMQSGKAYQTRLNPAPASLAVAHPWSWDGKPLELPTVLRVPLPESWQYVVNVMVELIWQAGGSLPWRILRSATDLLSDRNRLARLAELHVGQVALDWLALNGDSFDATHRWDQLSGLCHMGKLHVVRRDGELVVELLSTDGHLLFPHVRFDARLALTVARPLPSEPQTQEALQDERRVAELIPA